MVFLREATVDDMKWLNLTLALLGSLAAFGSLNKMVWGATRPCIIGATLLIALGLAGQWLSLIHEEWLQYVDTALYGGILALLIASQRNQTWFLERWANPAASAVALWAGVIFMLGLLTGCAQAPTQPEPQAQAAPPAQVAPAQPEVDIPVHVVDHHDGVRMRLLNKPCVDPVSLAMTLQLPPHLQERFRAIASEWRAKDGSWGEFAGCWVLVAKEEINAPDDVFVLLFSDREAIQIFKNDLLKKQNGV
jgi:hypothetical protein